MPPDAHRLRPADEPPATTAQGTIFVNFDGATLSAGSDDAPSNVTQIGQLAGPYAAYGEGEKREAVMQALRQDWAAYNVLLTTERPAAGPYVMNMTGPSNAFPSNVLGVAPLDCNDSQTHSNVTYAFHSANDSFSAATTATTVSQEVAHSFGLEHVADGANIMNPTNQGGDPSFKDECTQIVQGVSCGSQHEAQCGTPSQQNAHKELLALFGASVPDTSGPAVAITAPVDGDVFDAGVDIEVHVDAQDEGDVVTVSLWRNDVELGSDADAPYVWSLQSLQIGTYTMVARAVDASGNEAGSGPITITVIDDAPGSPNPGGGSESSGGSDPWPGDSDGDADEDRPSLPSPLGGTFGQTDPEVGCSCHAAPTTPIPLGLGMVVLLFGVACRRS
ncbi:MAG: Ig-like domain-containing protein [Myxococcota bacterium]